MKKVAVIGAGITGLACAYMLSNRGHQVVLFEKSDQVGGLANSVSYGDLIFDYGPHQIQTEKERIIDLLQEVLGDELLIIAKKAAQFFNQKYVNYPFTLLDFVKCAKIFNPFRVLREGLKGRIDAFFAKNSDNSFEEWVLRRFGKTLYNNYFGPYTKKVWGIDPVMLDPELASERIIFNSIFDLFHRNVLYNFFNTNHRASVHSPLQNEFFYCKKGIGTLSLRLLERCISKGVEMNFLHELRDVKTDDHQVASLLFSNRKSFQDFDDVISTIPITLLMDALGDGINARSLGYRSIVFVFAELQRKRLTPYHWVYFPDNNVCFQRLVDFSNFNAQMVTHDRVGIALEISCFSDDAIWRKTDDEIIEEVRLDLVKTNLIDSDECIEGLVKKVPHCYPIYFKGYQGVIQDISRRIMSFKNLTVTGRQGLYRYCNIPECIEMAYDVAERISAR